MKNLLIFHLFCLIFITFAERSTDAWTKEFEVTRWDGYNGLQEYLNENLQQGSEEEKAELPSVLLQRRLLGKRYSNGTVIYDNKVKYKPIVVVINKRGRSTLYLNYLYVSIAFLVAAGLLFVNGRAMCKSEAFVPVKNINDSNKPQREYPVSLTLYLGQKAEEKTPIIKKAPPAAKPTPENKKTK